MITKVKTGELYKLLERWGYVRHEIDEHRVMYVKKGCDRLGFTSDNESLADSMMLLGARVSLEQAGMATEAFDAWETSFDSFNPKGSGVETLAHIHEVQHLLGFCITELGKRRVDHDRTKLRDPERAIFDEFTPKLRDTTYQSEEYKRYLAAMKPALDHHYANTRHHPESHGSKGIHGMNLIDLLEMVLDWKAATLRHTDGDIRKSLELNQKRFGYSDELKEILSNTVDWIEEKLEK